ncbi:hypothetical protein [Salipaludibacillus sp. CF4.18]|uniref:hypothetical protein n=1 Tax=Salipaludibacillus sp. CF4.18 TaxID=3373081 RepID=UPI003EE67B89
MPQFVRKTSTYDLVLIRVVEVVTDYVRKEWPSPTIRQLSSKIGYSEEVILESIEFGTIEPATLLQ